MAAQTLDDMLRFPVGGCAPIAELYAWSRDNYAIGSGPMTVFLDLIDWSDNMIGEPINKHPNGSARFDHPGLGRLGAALVAYAADDPAIADRFVSELMTAEAEMEPAFRPNLGPHDRHIL